jgi:hypothetical protein
MAGPKSFDVVTRSWWFSLRAANKSPRTIEARAQAASPMPDHGSPGTPFEPCR